MGPLEAQGISIERVKNAPVKRALPVVPYQNGGFLTPDGKFNCISEYEGRPDPGSGLTLLMVKRVDLLNSQVLPDEAHGLPKVSLNTQVAEDVGVMEGDRVWIESVQGQIGGNRQDITAHPQRYGGTFTIGVEK